MSTRIKGEVKNFAEEAIEYIRALFEVASEEPTAKEDLKSIRTVVNDIYKWASERVVHSSFSL
ncbi:hypothetical protein B0H14DRAFT_3529828 [Mycena olivaceomarginata]|nr:hypothetical protein B0H14DRAFT_3529828 [Mycena olivaceomarginata]